MKQSPIVARKAFVALLLGVGLLSRPAQAEVQLNIVPITYANNPADTSVAPFNRGSVAYDFGMSKFEITNTQYTEFLNAKAQLALGSDTLGLWADGMRGSSAGGIFRSGSGTLADPYSYVVKSQMGNKPVLFVTYFDGLRFANWLTNGQGAGDTESGSYILTGGTATPSNWLSTPRQATGRYFLPSADEWYKAAYYQPSSAGGDADNYWAYPTASNTLPTQALPTAEGDVANPGPNVAIFDGGFVWGGSSGRGKVGTVGSAGGHSFFDVYDLAGNASEWTDTRWFGSPEPAYSSAAPTIFRSTRNSSRAIRRLPRPPRKPTTSVFASWIGEPSRNHRRRACARWVVSRPPPPGAPGSETRPAPSGCRRGPDVPGRPASCFLLPAKVGAFRGLVKLFTNTLASHSGAP